MKLAEKVGLLWRTAHRRVKHRAAQESSRPFQQLRALRAIAHQNIATQSALAERLCIDPAATSRLVDRLEKDGLLERRPGKDRRCVCLQTTPRAKGDIDAISREVEWLEAEMRGCLTDSELRTFERVLDKLNATLGAGR